MRYLTPASATSTSPKNASQSQFSGRYLSPTLYVWIARENDVLPIPEPEFENHASHDRAPIEELEPWRDHNHLGQKTSEKRFETMISWFGVGMVLLFLFWTFTMVFLEGIETFRR